MHRSSTTTHLARSYVCKRAITPGFSCSVIRLDPVSGLNNQSCKKSYHVLYFRARAQTLCKQAKNKRASIRITHSITKPNVGIMQGREKSQASGLVPTLNHTSTSSVYLSETQNEHTSNHFDNIISLLLRQTKRTRPHPRTVNAQVSRFLLLMYHVPAKWCCLTATYCSL